MGAGEAVRAAEKSRPALCVVTPIYGEVGAAMTGHFKVNCVSTLWLPGNDEVMAKEVGAVMIVWELWYGTVTQEASMQRDDVVFVAVQACVCWLLEGTNVLTEGKSIK